MKTKTRRRVHHRRIAARSRGFDSYQLQTSFRKVFEDVSDVGTARDRWRQIGDDESFWDALESIRAATLAKDETLMFFDKLCSRIGKPAKRPASPRKS